MVLLSILCSPALARLGDSVGECKKRYGQGKETPTGPADKKAGGTQTYKFRTHKYDVAAVFRDGRCVTIHYLSRNPKQALATETVAKLMVENAGGREWKEDPSRPIITHKTTDGVRVAAIRGGDVGFFEAPHWETLFDAITERPRGD